MKNQLEFKGGISRLWWIPLVTGLIAIGLGIWCFLSPESSMTVFAYVFSGLLVFTGLLNCTYGVFNTRFHNNWGWSLAIGIMEIICGIWLFCLPAEMLLSAFIFIMGIWIMVVIINSICEVCMLSAYQPGSILLMLILLLAGLAFTFAFLANPIQGGVAVWLWIGLSLLTFGIYRIILAFQLRKLPTIARGLF